VAQHQTGHNSGVIHAGLYYKPGSLKAKNCVEGREQLISFCEERGIPYDCCGKIVVATDESELPALKELARRGKANGLDGIKVLGAEELKEHEPHVRGVAGLHVPQTGIVDYTRIAEAYGEEIREKDGEIRMPARVESVERGAEAIVLQYADGEVATKNIINCAGLQCDRVARMCGVDPQVKIIPFRGEYYELVEDKCSLVRNLIYPVPDPRFPFLGVHFTRMIKGGVEAGPNAVLALKREGYRWGAIDAGDIGDMIFYPGFWHMAFKYGATGCAEIYRSFSKRAFVEALQKLVPEITEADVVRAGAGVRAQAVERDGKLVDDFRIIQAAHMIHVLNAPSPAATASISIGQSIAAMAIKQFAL